MNPNKIAPAAPPQMFSSNVVEGENGETNESWIRRSNAKSAVSHLVLLESAAVTLLLAAIFAPLEQLPCVGVICLNFYNVRMVAGAMALIALSLGILVLLALICFEKRLLKIFLILAVLFYIAVLALLLFVAYLIGDELIREHPTKGMQYHRALALLGMLTAALISAHGAWTMGRVVMSSPQRESAPRDHAD